MKRQWLFGLIALGLLVWSVGLHAKGVEWTKANGVAVKLSGAQAADAMVYQNQKNANQYLIFASGFAKGEGVLIDLATRDLFSVPKRFVQQGEGGATLVRKVSNLEKLNDAVLKISRGEKSIAVSIQLGGTELEITLPKP